MSEKTTVLVMFGGQSTEHDVSVLTGLQTIEAMDASRYQALPLYIDQEGQWWTGDALLQRKNYHVSPDTKKQLLNVSLATGRVKTTDAPQLIIQSNCFFGKQKTIPFDIALPAFHGTIGEDGNIQGLLETAGVPYIGCRTMASTVFMNKSLSKTLFKSAGIPVLEEIILNRPADNAFLDIESITKDLKVSYPVCAKPCHLGSSIGVHKATNKSELEAAILDIFKMDTQVVIEPFVENLKEYNVSVSAAFDGTTQVSAIERPKGEGAVLDFKDKYLSAGDMDSKLSVPHGQGMASAIRDIKPAELKPKQQKLIEDSAKKAFELVAGAGAPRIDFLCDSKSGKIWCNEVNPMPGSIGYYLWEEAEPKVGFTALVTALIEEGLRLHQDNKRVIDPQ